MTCDRPSDGEAIAGVEEVPEATTTVFRVRNDDGEEREAILLREGGDVLCWLNYCRHFTHVKLDKGSGATTRNGEILCTNHGATFEADTGECTFGPCEGALLEPVEVTVVDGEVYLDDPDYEFVGPGPIESEEFDLSSTSNVEF
jgi:nitrite reductase/ring-hydroxylating ferredoxin subunit